MKKNFCSLLIFACLLFANAGSVLAQEGQSCFGRTCVDVTSIKWIESDVPGAFKQPIVEVRGSREFADEITPAVMEVNCIEDSSVDRFRIVSVWVSEEEEWRAFDSRWGGDSEVVQYICGLSRGQD